MWDILLKIDLVIIFGFLAYYSYKQFFDNPADKKEQTND